MSERTTVVIPAALFWQMRTALMFANKVLVEDDTRFAAMDQNPSGVRDLVGSAALAVERYIVKGK